MRISRVSWTVATLILFWLTFTFGGAARASQIAVSYSSTSPFGNGVELYDFTGTRIGGFNPAGDVALKPNNVFSIEYDQITGDLYSLVDVSGLNAAKGVWRRNTDGTIDHVISEGADFSFNPASSISQFAPIPEPSRALLLLLGLGAVLVRRRRM